MFESKMSRLCTRQLLHVMDIYVLLVVEITDKCSCVRFLQECHYFIRSQHCGSFDAFSPQMATKAFWLSILWNVLSEFFKMSTSVFSFFLVLIFNFWLRSRCLHLMIFINKKF